MPKTSHEVRDVLYGFIEFDEVEKQLIDSAPFQRLRWIHQLAMCYQVYPGATHKRFEHSLGVMEMASRIFESVFGGRLSDQVHHRIAAELEPEKRGYWHRVVRIAALLHDIGHLAFSHSSESLLPEAWNHERLTAAMILESEIKDILSSCRPPIAPEDVVDLCWDVSKRAKVEQGFALTPWKTLLNEIITGNTFGADRIDYLQRDSLHAGVAYGRFDHERLIAGLRATIDPINEEIALGLDLGSIHAAESLLLARYLMYTQVYFHDVRRAYDRHLKEFLQGWLPNGKFPTDWREVLKITDNEVLAALRVAVADSKNLLHSLATPLMNRGHYRTIYEQVSTHKRKRPTILEDLGDFTRQTFGADKVRVDSYPVKQERKDFWVMTDDGSIESSLEVSQVIKDLPPAEFGFVFVSPELKEKAKTQLEYKLRSLLGEAPDYCI
jgi:HD superfamily phosphohydrolase